LDTGQPVGEISGTYTITLAYDYDYLINVLNLLPFEHRLRLYWWNPNTVAWEPVSGTLDLDNDELTATASAFGDFALIMDVKRVYMPLVTRSY